MTEAGEMKTQGSTRPAKSRVLWSMSENTASWWSMDSRKTVPKVAPFCVQRDMSSMGLLDLRRLGVQTRDRLTLFILFSAWCWLTTDRALQR